MLGQGYERMPGSEGVVTYCSLFFVTSGNKGLSLRAGILDID